jgi:hypothetical protein
MESIGPKGYFLVIGSFFAGLGGYAAWRKTRRAAPTQGIYAGLSPTASTVAVGAVLDNDQRR